MVGHEPTDKLWVTGIVQGVNCNLHHVKAQNALRWENYGNLSKEPPKFGACPAFLFLRFLLFLSLSFFLSMNLYFPTLF